MTSNFSGGCSGGRGSRLEADELVNPEFVHDKEVDVNKVELTDLGAVL